MRKHTIIGVIVLMSISLLGVVGIQLYWINNAIKVKQQLFERNVHDALANVVDKLETREAVSVVTKQLASLKSTDSLPSVEVIQTPDERLPNKFSEKKNKATEVSKEKRDSKTTKSSNTATPTNPAKVTATRIPAAQIVRVTPIHPEFEFPNVYVRQADSIRFRTSYRTAQTYMDTFFHSDTAKSRKVLERLYTGAMDTAGFRKLMKGQTFTRDNLVRVRVTGTPHLPGHKIFSISADTLRHLNVSLDSLKPIEISSVQVKNDSVFIYKQGSSKPLYAYKPEKHKSNMTFKFNTTATQVDTVPVRIRGKRISQAQVAQAISLTAPQAVKVAPAVPAKTTAASLKATAVEKIENKKEKLNDVVQKMMVEYVVKEIPLKERLNEKNLQALLSDELKDKGIDLEYGYHVVSAENDTVVETRVDQTLKADKDTKYFATFLFPNDIVEKPDYLAVYFPDTQAYAIKSLAGMMSLSGLFTLIIIATFATTIHIIYKQKRLSEMKNDFINNMTHEFKTPIATISLATDSIFNPKVYDNPEKIKYYTSIIKEENKRMNAQVENVLQIALLEKNEFRLNLQPIDVHMLILKATESIRFQVEQRLGKISVNLQALNHELQTDEMHLFNVICNLLDNANKYSPATPEIELSTQNIEGGLLIAVDDKGMGMSKDTQQRVFEKFYRVPTGNLHNVKGFGLGLSYVKAIVEAHHGTIKLWSEPGKGSRFEIFLPLKK